MSNENSEVIQEIIDQCHELAEAGHLAESRNLLTKRLEIEQNARIYRARGDVHMDLTSYSSAIDDYSHALELCPDNATYFCRRGMAEVAYGNRTKGINDLNKAIELDPDLLVAYQILCGENIKKQFRNLKSAKFCIERMRELAGDTGETKFYEGQYFFSLGELEKSIGCYEEALSYYETAKDIEPDLHAVAFAGLASAYKATNAPSNFSKAIVALSKGLELDPDPIYYCDRANIFLLLGEHQNALDDLSTVRSLELDDTARQYLKRIEKRVGSKNSAE